MSVTAQNIIDTVKRSLAIPTTNTTRFTNDELIFHINAAITYIASRAPVSLVETAISVNTATRVYDLPAGTMQVEWAQIEGEQQTLVPVDPATLNAEGETELTGKPWGYCQRGEQIILHPFPDASYMLNVVHTKTPALVTNVTDTVDLSAIYTDAIPFYVSGMCLLREKDEMAGTHLTLWTNAVTNAIRVERDRENSRFPSEIRAVSANYRPQIINVRPHR